MTDTELLEDYAQNRSEAAFAALIERYLSLVYSSCWRQLRDRHLAEDATQAVFLLLSRKAGMMRHPALAGWLLMTARYTCANIRKMEERRVRRETAVAMEMARETENHSNQDELLGMLDEGLSRLRESDREAIALRFLQGQSLVEVGAALGISEEAARKRVDRGVEKLRSYFGRRGVTTASAALPMILAEQTRAAITADIQASMVHGILQASCGSAGATPGIAALAKGTNMMIQIARLKVAALALVISMTVTGAGVFSAMRVMADGAGTDPASAATSAAANPSPPAGANAGNAQSDDAKYQACRDAMVAIIDAHDKQDAAAMMAQFYISPDADPQMEAIVPALVNADLAVYRLQKAAIGRFGAHAVGLNYYWDTSVLTLEDLLSRVERKDAQFEGDTVVFNPSAPLFERAGIWPAAPFYFQLVDGAWKIDLDRTLQLKVSFTRRIAVEGETPDQTLIAAETDFVKALDVITDDTNHGKIASAGEIQRRLDGAVIGMSMRFSNFNVNMGPK
jgi:RNA polymerase sigma factor (sigma-70 family)